MQHPIYAPNAYTAIARAVEQIIYTYVDLVSIDQLNTTWPQLQRLVIAGQLLILCYDAGEFHKREAQTLFQLLIDMLLQHQGAWPQTSDLIAGFKSAAQVFGKYSNVG